MQIGACLVSWPTLVAKWNAHDADRNAHSNDSDWDESDRQSEFYFDARDDEQQAWINAVDLWDESPVAAACMANVYEKLRLYLKPNARTKIDKLFGAFFWPHEANGLYAIHFVQELSDKADGEVFAAAMRPATVPKYLALWAPAAFERLRQPFQAEFPDGVDRVANFGEFKQYAEMWVGLLREAVKRKRGLVISWC